MDSAQDYTITWKLMTTSYAEWIIFGAPRKKPFAQARQLWEKAVALDPQYAEAYAWLGYLLAGVDLALECSPSDPGAFVRRWHNRPLPWMTPCRSPFALGFNLCAETAV